MVWTDAAVAELDAVTAYIAAENPLAAIRLAQRLVALADSLAEFPYRGRVAEENARELPTVWPYILRYRVEGNSVLILRIRHGARGGDGLE
ncbi:MAG TPA: type II toxin-antitoxin system RelE/ParE family toxin [Allosphingosinicella sp.]